MSAAAAVAAADLPARRLGRHDRMEKERGQVSTVHRLILADRQSMRRFYHQSLIRAFSPSFKLNFRPELRLA